MAKKFFNNLVRLGACFVVFDTSRTGTLPIYRSKGDFFARTRDKDRELIKCEPCVFAGVKHGFKQVDI